MLTDAEKEAEQEPHVPSPEPARRRGLIARLPDIVAVAAAGFGLPSMILLLTGFFVIPLAILLGIVCAGVAVAFAARGDNETREYWESAWAGGALLLALAFFVATSMWSAQNVNAIRAPATNTLAGQWLVHHKDVRVPTQEDVFGDVGGITADSRGFRTDLLSPENVYAQGNHLLPAALGIAGWLGGPEALFRLNALVGALALLAFFGLARRFVGGGFALAAAAALAVSLPMLAFSRDAYTEPVTLLLLFGGLSMLWRAIGSNRPSHFLIAGFTLASAALARIDVYSALAVVLAVAAVFTASAPRGQRAARAGRTGALLGGMAVPGVLSYLDVTRLSSGYYHDLRGSIVGLMTVLAVVVGVGAVVVAVVWSSPAVGRLFSAAACRWWSLAAAGAVVAVFAVLASRPLWLTARGDCRSSVGALQQAAGEPVDPCRTYAEHSLSWLAWYYGWPVIVVGILGAALFVHHTVRTRDIRRLSVAAPVLGGCALYLAIPNVSPDQIWAMRRYLPLVIPGLLMAAGYLLYRLAERGRPFRVVAVLLGLGLVALPAYISRPMAQVRTGVPQLAQVKAVCRALPDNAAVLSLGRAENGSYTQTMRSFCNVPSYAMDAPTTAALAEVRRSVSSHDRTLFVIAEAARFIPVVNGRNRAEPRPFYTVRVSRWPERLLGVPDAPLHYDVPLYLGQVNPDGTVTMVTRGGRQGQ